MSSLGEKIAKLTNPTPEIIDPEDTIDIDSTTKAFGPDVCEFEKNEISDLRKKTAPLLEDVDPTYAGRKISRRKLGHIFNEDSNIISSDNNSAEESEGDVSNSEGSEEDDDVDDFEMKKFKNLLDSQSKESSEEESYVDDDDDDNNNSIEEEEESETEDIENKSNDEITEKFSNIDVTSEIERGQAIKNQNEIWNRLLETRIKLQKLLLIANKLPQFEYWEKLREKGGKDLTENLKKGSQSMKHIMQSCISLHSDLMKKNKEIGSSSGNNSDEEIMSETDEDSEKSDIFIEEKKGVKRKLKEDFENTLEKHFKCIIPYRNSVIQKWHQKTQLSSGRMSQKSFSAFDVSAVKLIEQSLQDKQRLVRRTQLKRSLYRVLGKPETSEQDSENVETEVPVPKQDLLLKDYDPEIFDDDDFYRQLLKDVIESKSFGINAAAIRKQIDIQKIRNKMKRKVDTKASKGRRLRYDVHPKIVNFQAPVLNSGMPDEARNTFLKCIFAGKNPSSS